MKDFRTRGRVLSLRGILLSGLSLAAMNTAALAQQGEAASDEIVVTGSRIRENPLESGRPVLNLDAEQYNRSGLNNIGDFLQRLPASGGGLNSRVNSSGNFGNPPDGGGVGAGSAEIDLRYLGSRRTLVLVDGLRWVNGASASGVPGATDLNTIPSSMIQRIEVLQDGASPIYGSDAIAGVINIITKQEQDGFAASAQLGAYQPKDGETQQYEVSFGASNDNTKVFFAAQYVHQNSVSSADRDLSNFPVATLNQCISNCSSATPFGRFFLTDPNTMTDLNLTLADSFSYAGANPAYNPLNPGGGGDDFKPFTTADRFNFSPFNYVVTPSERLGFFTQVTHDVTDSVTFRVKAVYNNRRSANQAAPIPIFIGPEAGNGNRLDTISIDQTNPFNPFGFTIDSATNPYFIGRRLFEAGPRHFEQNVDTFYVSGTLDGDFNVGGRNFYWDASALWSRNKADQLAYGIVNSARLQQALGPISQCTNGCVPFNIFGGPGSITQAQLDYITFVQHDTSEQELWDVSFNVGGDIADLWAGPLSFAAGFEHRDQSGSFTPDPIVAAGDSADIPAQPTSGSFNVDEIYGEFKLPLIADSPFARLFEVNFAVRNSRYSTGFSDTTIKAGGLWRPTDDLTFRGGYTQGFRAATIGELFGTASRFDQVLSDPCSDLLGLNGGQPATAAVIANCGAIGVPTDGSYTQFNAQISVTTGGNPNLGAETSKGWNGGFTYAPEWADNLPLLESLVIEGNFYDIKIDGAIQPLDAQLQLDGCINTLDSALCNGIVRTPTGVISSFNNRLTNIGGINTRGFDWSFTYTVPLGSAGDINVQSLNTYLIDYTELSPTSTGFLEIPREGTLRGSPQLAFPRYKSTLIANWTLGSVQLRGVGRYISSLTEQCRDLTEIQAIPGAVGCSNYNATDDALSTNKLDAKVYIDLAASYTLPWFSGRSEFTIGVNNVLETDPPPCFSCQLNGFDPNTYDPPGRYGYVRLTWRP